MRTIRRGDGYKATLQARPAVKAAQIMTAHHGYADLRTIDRTCAADGIFGPGTESAIRRFQKSVGLSSSGIVDRDTWAALES